MAPLSRLLLAPIAIAFALSGCVEPEFGIHAKGSLKDQSEKFQDADDRISSNSHYGGSHESETVNVPLGATSLRVRAAYSFQGAAHVSLHSPDGRTVKQISVSGDNSEEDSQWYKTNRPMAGDWTLTVSASGQSSYSFGFYY